MTTNDHGANDPSNVQPSATPPGRGEAGETRDWLEERRLRRLLEQRDRLAVAAAELDGHGLPGGHILYQQVHDLEEQLRLSNPDSWAGLYAGWVRQDAARIHSPEWPQPDTCGICRLTAALRAAQDEA